jgi:hypothetical protein
LYCYWSHHHHCHPLRRHPIVRPNWTRNGPTHLDGPSVHAVRPLLGDNYFL